MSPALQRTIDDIASRLHQPVLLEDVAHGLLAYSRHEEKIDDVREQTILGRGANPDVAAWLALHLIGRAVRPVRIPANPELSMLPRLCLPVRHHDDLLGYLWIVEVNGRLSDDFVQAAEAAAARIADTLWDTREVGRRHVSVILARIAEGLSPATADLIALTDQDLALHSPYRMVALGARTGDLQRRPTDSELRSDAEVLAPWEPVSSRTRRCASSCGPPIVVRSPTVRRSRECWSVRLT